MTQTIQRYLNQLAAIVGISLVLALPLAFVSASNVFAAPSTATEAVCNGVSKTGGGCDPDGAADEVDSLIQTIVNLFSIVVGVVAVIMIIIGGLKYITSGGDSSGVSSAKNTILYAIIGLVIVALAQTIVRFVIGKVA